MGKRGRSRTPPRFEHKFKLPPPPLSFRCLICANHGHYTLDCPEITYDRERFPHVDLARGCWICGVPNHSRTHCPRQKRPCVLCGDVHQTDRCPYDDQPRTMHELWDLKLGEPYYHDQTTGATTWEVPLKIDEVLWLCEPCNHLLPNRIDKCPTCERLRPSKADRDTPLSKLAVAEPAPKSHQPEHQQKESPAKAAGNEKPHSGAPPGVPKASGERRSNVNHTPAPDDASVTRSSSEGMPLEV